MKGKQWAQGRAFLIAIFIGMTVSLIIELLQSYLPTRDSSMTDLICNTIGTIIGVIFFQCYFSHTIKNSITKTRKDELRS
ncbi:hypothetical protein DRH13_05565 [Candidatus Woesebacteria bacterium]|nr:MAG: hypothetical protein DRH13_05565 [Candidatus Woesebacteria bacterium]